VKSGLKKLATHAGYIPQDNPEMILEIFNRIDTDKSGAIDPDEFRTLVKDLHLKLDDVEIMALFKSIDSDGNGTIEFNEFLAWWQNSVSGNTSMSDAAWDIRLGLSEAELEAATGMLKPAGKEPSSAKDDEKEEDGKEEGKAPKKKTVCAMKWTDVDKVGDKWHAPGKHKKEKNLQCAQFSESHGVVALRGCLISEGGASAVAFVLPANCVPKSTLRFTTFVSSGKKSAPADVVISPDGKVTVSTTDEGEFWFSGISYDH